MRLLVEECVDENLRLMFPGHDCQTARFAKLAGLKNGRLLDEAERAGFDVLVTVDQNIPEQQNLLQRSISIVILCGPTNRLRDLEPLVSRALAALTLISRRGAHGVWAIRRFNSSEDASLRYAIQADGDAALDGQIGKDSVRMLLHPLD